MVEKREKMGVYGSLHLVLKDEYGNIKQDIITDNTITVYHDAVVAAQMNYSTGSVIAFITFGKGHHSTGSSAETGMDSGFQTDARKPVSRVTSAGADDNDLVLTHTSAAGNFTGTIREAGLFLTSGTSDMMCYAYYPDVNVVKGASDTLATTWTITYGAS